MTPLARTPRPPYYAVIFTSLRTAAERDGYEAMAERMVELAQAQPGFLGLESTRGPDGLGITVSYWASLDAVRGWRLHVEHQAAQARGRSQWYGAYTLRICRVEHDYGYTKDIPPAEDTRTLP